MTVRARYVGGYDERPYQDIGPDGKPVTATERVPRGHLPGVPARNLTEDEYQELDADQRKAVRDSGLYEVRSDAEMAPPKPTTDKG